MSNQQQPLAQHSFIGNYLVLEILSMNKNSISYLTEDMKLGKKFIVSEFFPQAFSSRDSDKQTIVYHNEKSF